MGDGFFTDADFLVEVMGNDEPKWMQKIINGVSYSIIAQSLHDYSGAPIGVVEIAMNNTYNKELLASTRNNALLISLIILILGLWGSWLTANYFIRRIHLVTHGVNYIAQGDLSHSIHLDGQDELADLARAANSMRQQLGIMATTVSEHAHTVQKAAREINNAVENQAATSSQMSSSVAEITSTMEELSASSTQIADHSKLVVDVANQAMTGSYKGSEAMQVVLVRMEDIRHDNQASLQEIIELGTKSKQISKIMSLITNLADQTKLIAFNAALEASSAGEAGKRFSVVASEIRRLADSVTDSTDEIEAKINEIQDAISRLVITSEKGANGILAGTTASNHTAERFNEIVSAVNQTSITAQQISLSTQQQKTASSQVVVALREIVSASAHTATAISKVAQISHEMANVSEQLSQATEFFKLGDKD
jgi:methyl-accepting chemotaxis protein